MRASPDWKVVNDQPVCCVQLSQSQRPVSSTLPAHRRQKPDPVPVPPASTFSFGSEHGFVCFHVRLLFIQSFGPCHIQRRFGAQDVCRRAAPAAFRLRDC